MIDPDDDQRLDLARRDHAVRGLVEIPFLAAERRGGVEQVLAVVHVEHGIAAVQILVVAGRQMDEDVAVVAERG
jgi:hypothetical protein